MKPRSSAAILLLLSSICLEGASVIYSEDFTAGAGSLNGEAPTTQSGSFGGSGSATWVASSQWSEGGVRNSTLAGTAGANAYLPFTPVSGTIYTLSLEMDISNVTNRYFALGFFDSATPSTSANFQNAGSQSWAFLRADDLFSGSGDSEISIMGGVDLDQRTDILRTKVNPDAGKGIFNITLDTTSTSWTTTWEFQDPSTLATTALGSLTYTTNPTINSVGFGASGAGSGGNAAIGSVSSFQLSQVPEPAGALAGLLVGFAVLRDRRRSDRL